MQTNPWAVNRFLDHDDRQRGAAAKALGEKRPTSRARTANRQGSRGEGAKEAQATIAWSWLAQPGRNLRRPPNLPGSPTTSSPIGKVTLQPAAQRIWSRAARTGAGRWLGTFQVLCAIAARPCGGRSCVRPMTGPSKVVLAEAAPAALAGANTGRRLRGNCHRHCRLSQPPGGSAPRAQPDAPAWVARGLAFDGRHPADSAGPDKAPGSTRERELHALPRVSPAKPSA